MNHSLPESQENQDWIEMESRDTLVHLFDRVSVSLSGNIRESVYPPRSSQTKNVLAKIVSDDCPQCSVPSSLADIYAFHKNLSKILDVPKDQDLTILMELHQAKTAALLLGCYMIVGRGMSADEVKDRFRPVKEMYTEMTQGDMRCKSTGIMIEDYWSGLHRAAALGRVNFDPPEGLYGQDLIDMDEYLHYDDTANGAMHLVDPSRVLLFREPADLPAGTAWRDEGGRRLFGAEHYAGLFVDFGVGLAVRCGGGAWDDAALGAAGIAVEDMRATARGAGTLAAVDRFLTLARSAPGCIAVQCGRGGGNGGAGRDQTGGGAAGGGSDAAARLVVAAHLIRGRGFTAAGALAWTHIAHPAAAARQPAAGLMLVP